MWEILREHVNRFISVCLCLSLSLSLYIYIYIYICVCVWETEYVYEYLCVRECVCIWIVKHAYKRWKRFILFYKQMIFITLYLFIIEIKMANSDMQEILILCRQIWIYETFHEAIFKKIFSLQMNTQKCLCMCMYIYIYIYIYIYTHTYIYIYTHTCVCVLYLME